MTGLAPCKKLVAQLVKNSPAMQETWVQPLGWEEPPEKGKAAHSSVLAWRIHGLYSPWGHKESDTTERLSLSLSVKKRKRPERSRSPSLPGHRGTVDPGKRALTEADRAGPREGRKRIRAVSPASDSSPVTSQDAHASPRCGPGMGP